MFINNLILNVNVPTMIRMAFRKSLCSNSQSSSGWHMNNKGLRHIEVKTQDVSASSLSDYASLDRTVRFSPDSYQTKEQITLHLNITNDKILENNETLSLTFTTIDNRVNILCPNTTVWILNDETYIFFCKPLQTSVRENAGKYKVNLCRAGRTSVPHLIKLCWTSDGNGRLHDYPSIKAGCDEITFPAGKNKIQHSIKITNDSWGEQEHKTFQLRILTNESTVFFNDTSSYNVTLIDDDNSFCLKKMAFNVTEENHRFLNILVERFGAISTTNASVRPIAVPDQVKKALSPDDYEFPNNNQSLMFSLNEVEKNITITIKDDKLAEDHQIFILSLYGVGLSTVFPSCNTSRTTIVSNDVDIRCNGLNSAMQQGFENESSLVVNITREGSIEYNHTIRIRTVADSAKPQSDFIPVDKVITFIAGQKNIQQNVIIVNDLEVEKAERFHLELTSNDSRVNIICKRITYVIKDEDTMVTCPKSLTVSENTKMVTLQLEREGYLNRTSNMWISTLDGTAYDKADFAPANRRNVTFYRGENISSVSIEIVDDDVPEKLESFSILLGSEDNTTTPITSSICMNITINDDDKDEDKDRITAKQAQEILDSRKRISNLLIAGLGAASVIVLILIILLIAVCVCF
ncbi:G-protein coupled receptor 98 [Exaiptasia diaphana]|nr:G-protein coupled receptor 98 [Exaiptasia diaphana]